MMMMMPGTHFLFCFLGSCWCCLMLYNLVTDVVLLLLASALAMRSSDGTTLVILRSHASLLGLVVLLLSRPRLILRTPCMRCDSPCKTSESLVESDTTTATILTLSLASSILYVPQTKSQLPTSR